MTRGAAAQHATQTWRVTDAVDPIAERIDASRVEVLRSTSLPRPIHAINYVRLRSVALYRLYSVLLLPYALPKGVRPVWVAEREAVLLGNSEDDEIVIVEYPDHGTLLNIVTSSYYGRINGLRERGVQHLGFSINEQLETSVTRRGDSPSLGKGSYLVVRFAGPDHPGLVFDSVRQITRPLGEPAYASRVVGHLDIFSDVSPKDPVPTRLPNILVFGDDVSDSDVREVVDALSREDEIECDVQRFRTLGVLEALGLR